LFKQPTHSDADWEVVAPFPFAAAVNVGLRDMWWGNGVTGGCESLEG
jgi:hypothetical protein